MRIELRGIIQSKDEGHTNVDLIVTEGRADKYKRHRLGVDIKSNRGNIITFLAGFYGVPPGEIVWPDHIELPIKGR